MSGSSSIDQLLLRSVRSARRSRALGIWGGEQVTRAVQDMHDTAASVGASTEPDAAFHMRFGDKVGTNNYVPTPLAEYVARFEAVAAAVAAEGASQGATTDSSTVFVATDDEGAVRAQMGRLDRDVARVRFRFASGAGGRSEGGMQGDTAQSGHSEQHFNKLASAERFKRHVQLLAELRALSRAPIFVCDYKSKLALLAEVLRAPNATTVTVGAHGPVWMPGG